jgi:hypothetical protein
MNKLTTLLALTSLAACHGGAIQVDVAMPRAGGVTQSPTGVITSSEGVQPAVDGVDPCERLRVKVFTAPPTATSTPRYTGGGLGTYDRTSPTPTCKALAAQLDPGEYWVRIEFPEEFYFRNPSIRMPGDTSSSSIVGQVGPLKVVDKQTTKAAVTLTAP